MPVDLSRAVFDDDNGEPGTRLRDRLVDRVMARDHLTKQQATAIVNGLRPHDLTRLEMETRDHEQPAFTSEYNPYG